MKAVLGALLAGVLLALSVLLAHFLWKSWRLAMLPTCPTCRCPEVADYGKKHTPRFACCGCGVMFAPTSQITTGP